MKPLLFVTIALYTFISLGQESIIDANTGVKISFSAAGKIFPDSWYSERIDAQAISLEASEFERSEEIVKVVLQDYPAELIQRNLKAVFVLKNITFYGQSFGGTNSIDTVYLSNEGVISGYTDFYLEQLFHAEFSSILLRNHKPSFDESEWIRNNPSDFTYGNGGVAALKENNASETFDTELNRMGFINEYATSSLENDFNAFAKNLFLPKEGFSNLVETYERIRNKRKQIIAFYNQLDSSLTQAYFDTILYPNKN